MATKINGSTGVELPNNATTNLNTTTLQQVAAKAVEATDAAKDYTNSQAIGVGQTWQNVTSSRSIGVTYTNTTGRPIFVQVQTVSTNASTNSQLAVNGTVVSYSGLGGSGWISTVSALVPPGSTYSLITLNVSISAWNELR